MMPNRFFQDTDFALNTFTESILRLCCLNPTKDDIKTVLVEWVEACRQEDIRGIAMIEKQAAKAVLSDDFLEKLHMLNAAMTNGGINSRETFITVVNFINNLQHVASKIGINTE